MIDVGAQVGFMATRAARAVGNGRLLAIEPDPASFEKPEANVRDNGLRNATPIHCALSERKGTMTFVAVASSALGPVVFSLARDSTGTYEQAAMILALLPITVALAAAVLRPARIPRPD